MKHLLLILTVLCVGFTSSYGTTFTVSNTNNSGAGSLRKAIDDANADNTATAANPHIIDAIGVTGTISVTIDPANSLFFLVITNHMTIKGSGAANLTISGNGTNRIFWVQNGTITLQDLTLANGYARGGGGAGGGMGAGGAIFMHEGKQDPTTATGVLSGSIDLRLLNVTLKNNQAIGGTGGTGGVGGGGLGGNGGTGAGGVLGNGIQAGGSVTNASGNVGFGGYIPGTNGGIAIFGPGGGPGFDGTNTIPRTPPGFGGGGSGGSGGIGGFGGGGGIGSKGGFGGGGGSSPVGSGVIGGFGGGSGSFLGSGGFGGFGGGGAEGGAGAGFGGAIFVASGKLTLQGVTFDGNTATGGSGIQDKGKGKGYGGALFIFNKADDGGTAAPGTTNDPQVVGCNVTFTSNSASDDPNSATNNDNLFGTIASASITINAPTVTQPTCTTPTGTIVVNASVAGGGTLEYSVNNGSTWQSNATFSGLAVGNYTIKVRLQASPTCEATYASNPVVLASPFTASTTTDTWTGCVSTDWAVAGNWADGTVPTAADDVVIPSAPTNQPTLSTTATAKSVEVRTGASLSISSAGSLTINNFATLGGFNNAFYNQGTVTNGGTVILGNTAPVGQIGIRNTGTFTNTGTLQIDRVTNEALINGNVFANTGTIAIGSLVSGGFNALWNQASFSNSAGGRITIDRANNSALYNTGSNFVNSATITIGASASVTGNGLTNEASFTNTTGGLIQIDQTGGRGIANTATFINAATINVGSLSTVTGNGVWVSPSGSFSNNAGGNIIINRSGQGLVNDGTFVNSASVTIGNVAFSSQDCIYNTGPFVNNATGEIRLDRAIFNGIWHLGSTIQNAGKIIVGAIAGPSSGILAYAPFTNTGEIRVDRCVNGVVSTSSFTNTGQITIGASASLGNSGVVSTGASATFVNSGAGTISIDRTGAAGLANRTGSTFTNSATITIGSTTSIGGEGIDNRGTFNNNTGGDIKIDRTGRGLLNHTATFNNSGLITIGALASVGQRGLNNFGSTAMFNNNTGGEIKIDNASAIGLYNESGTFNNTAKITIGATVSAGMASNGLTNDATFNNNTGGQITIDRVTSRGIQNNNPFSNTGEIRIGATAITAQDCIRNTNSFINHSGGKIYLDRAWGNGIWTSGNSFQNSGEITVGSIANMGVAILNTGTFSNNALGSIQLDRVTRGMTNTSTFNNAGQIKMGNNVPLRSSQGLLNGNGSGMVAAVFNNLAGGLLQIDQTPANQDGIINELLTTFTNAGTVSIGTLGSIGGHGINNAGTFSNNACAILTVFDNLNNSSTFTNAGFFTVKTAQVHTNSALTNNGIIEYPQGNPIPNVTNNDVIIAPISTCGVLTPALQIGGSNSFTVGGTWYKDASMMATAGTYSGNTFTVTDLTVGAHTLYFTVTDPANACPRTVGINVTVNPASVGGTVGAAQTICAGTSPADLTLTGNAGNVVKWQKSTDLAFTSPTDIAGTSTTLTGATIGNLTANTYFRAVVKNGVCDEVNSEAVLITVNQQEINLQGGSPLTNIPDGDNTPTAAKGTDFGSFEVIGNVIKTFTVQNTGSSPLNISSIVSNNGLFVVSGLTLPATITAGGSATFTVTFSPTATGVQNATITVNNNDCDEAVYDFAVTGNAVCPAIVINAPSLTQSTCTTPTGTIMVNATGSGTLEYSIDNGSNWQSSATFGDLAAGNYNIKVRSQAFPTCTTTYASNPVVITLKTPPSVDAGSCKFVYNGYGSNCTNLTASATGVAGGFTYSWSPGNLSGATVQVCPTVTTTYTVTVTDANGCTSTDEVTVEVIDVRCGNSNAVEKVLVCFGGKSLCVAPTAVPALLANGATLGACGITPCGTQSNARIGVESDEATRPTVLMMQVYPNPTAGLVTVDLRNVSKGLARIEVVDLIGRPLVQKTEQMNEGANQLSFDFKHLPDGLYLIRCRDSQNHEAVVKVNKL
ncbi:hypothetical protein DR864_12095 [Runella rosea]|uniref:Uncharacterized protein n=1 Tax=Runella rosea TaxID=2259595 RepID=A0A344TIG9_9BACT|nr:choice-of-anchor D domain-containing protein [Runella rosea]AXE18440.1 hypothetical protein DR864_12095 [Runella rosea]